MPQAWVKGEPRPVYEGPVIDYRNDPEIQALLGVVTDEEVALRAGVAKSTVAHWRRRLHIARAVGTGKLQKALLARLAEQGPQTTKELAAWRGVARQAIHEALMNLEFHQKVVRVEGKAGWHRAGESHLWGLPGMTKQRTKRAASV